MTRSVRYFFMTLFSLIIIVSFLLTGCTRHANEEQLMTLDETQKSAVSAEEQIAEKEKEKAALEAKLAEKQAELKKVQEEKVKVQSKLGE